MRKVSFLLFIVLMLVVALGIPACQWQRAAGPPVIELFEASPATIAAGESAELNWKVSSATSVSIDQGIGPVALGGKRAVAPAETTTYTLTASNAAGSVTATTQVIVSGTSKTPPPETPSPGSPPVVDYFTASPGVVNLGSSATLSWRVANAASVTIEPGVGTFGPSGSTVVSPSGSTTYILTASNSAGSASATATVNVLASPEPPPTPSFRVTDVLVSVTPTSHLGCPYNFTCSVTITATAAGTVTYRWERSDGGYSPTQTMTFTAAGSKTATTGWPRDVAGTYWVRVRVLTPNELVSNEANFTLACLVMPPPTPAFQVTSVTVSVIPIYYAGSCPAKFNCEVSITTDGPGTVTYKWVRSDGESPIQTMVFTSAGTQTAQTGWSPPQGRAWLYVETISPNRKTSVTRVVQNNCH